MTTVFALPPSIFTSKNSLPSLLLAQMLDMCKGYLPRACETSSTLRVVRMCEVERVERREGGGSACVQSICLCDHLRQGLNIPLKRRQPHTEILALTARA